MPAIRFCTRALVGLLASTLIADALAQSWRNGTGVSTPAAAFRAGQQVVIDVEGAYFLGRVDRVSREEGCTRVDYRWTSQDRYGSGYDLPDCTQFATIYTLEEARRQGFAVANASPAPSAPAPSNRRQPEVPAGRTTASGGQLDPARIREVLDAHNRWRTEVGVPKLSWSGTVAAGAQAWANRLAVAGSLDHDASSAHGENLFQGSGPRTPTEAIDSWGSERAECNYRGQAVGSLRCVVGHYTQMVWRATREVGCGVARTADGSHIWVCRYHPAGNMVGERPY